MQKKLTISIDEQVYEGLYKFIGKGAISQFIENLVRPHVIEDELEAEYREMAADERQEASALEWSEALNRRLWPTKLQQFPNNEYWIKPESFPPQK